MGLSLASRIRSGFRSSALPLALGVAALLVGIAGEPAFLTLRYERGTIADGEFWRLATAHLVHLGWSHLLLNLAGLVLVWTLVGQAFSSRVWLCIAVVSIAAMDAGFWFLMPSLAWYVGLSGLLHGLFAAGIIGSFVRNLQPRTESAMLGLLLAGKLGWETWQGALPGSAGVAGGDVVTESHLYGAIGGAVAGLLCAWIRRRNAQIRVRTGAPI